MNKQKQCQVLSYIIVILFLMHCSIDASSQVERENINQLVEKVETVSDLDSVNAKLCVLIKEVFFKIEKYGLCNDVNSISIYEIIQLIYNKSLTDDKYIHLLIELDSIIKRNAEIGQHLTELQHKIALNNTKGFIRVYESLPVETREKVRNNLTWLVEYNKQNLFLARLDSIEYKQQETITELKEFFKEY